MARNDTVTVAADTWTQITNANVTAITFQNIGSNYVLIASTNGTTAPTDLSGAFRYNPGTGERAVALSDLFPGVSGANRVWAYSVGAVGSVRASHA